MSYRQTLATGELKRVVPRVVCLICLSLALTCKHLIIFYTLYNDFHSQSFWGADSRQIVSRRALKSFTVAFTTSALLFGCLFALVMSLLWL